MKPNYEDLDSDDLQELDPEDRYCYYDDRLWKIVPGKEEGIRLLEWDVNLPEGYYESYAEWSDEDDDWVDTY